MVFHIITSSFWLKSFRYNVVLISGNGVKNQNTL